MNGEAPVAIPTTFENTKFPSVAKKIKNLVTSREEALAAHELARSHMVERIKSNFVPFKKGQMVWLDSRHLKTNYHKKMAPKREGPFKIEEVLGLVTYQLKHSESWQILPCCIAPSSSRKRGLWKKLYPTTTRHRRRRRSVQSGTNFEAQETWTRL
jgi:hypothetical protein